MNIYEKTQNVIQKNGYKGTDYETDAINLITEGVRSLAKTFDVQAIKELSEKETKNALISNDKAILNTLLRGIIINLEKDYSEDISKKENSACITAITAMHNKWVTEHKEDFFNPNKISEQYKHSPLPLLGWENANKYLKLLEPVLDSVHIDVDQHNLKLNFEQRHKKYKTIIENNGLGFIAQSYSSLKQQPDVIAAFSNEKLAKNIINGYNNHSIDKIDINNTNIITEFLTNDNFVEGLMTDKKTAQDVTEQLEESLTLDEILNKETNLSEDDIKKQNIENGHNTTEFGDFEI